MKRTWITALNALLGLTALALLGFAVRQVAVGLLTDLELEVAASEAQPEPAPRSFSDHSVIIGRNLFNADTLAPVSLATTESLEATRLPLKLIATLAAGDASYATIEDSGSQQRMVARVQQPLCRPNPFKPCSYNNVTLERVERCRVVLENQNRREELRLEGAAGCSDNGAFTAARRSHAPATARGRGVRSPVQRLAENRFAVPRAAVENAAQNPAALYSQARILPRYEEGRMVGVQLNAIRPGSLFAQVGIQDGDTVTQVNGLTVSTPEDGQRLLQEFSSGGQLRVTVRGRDGQVRDLEYVAQ